MEANFDLVHNAAIDTSLLPSRNLIADIAVMRSHFFTTNKLAAVSIACLCQEIAELADNLRDLPRMLAEFAVANPRNRSYRAFRLLIRRCIVFVAGRHRKYAPGFEMDSRNRNSSESAFPCGRCRILSSLPHPGEQILLR